MTNRTALYDQHVAMNGKIVDFAGWEMPINYGSQLDEHNQVRQDAGMFDVSHMVVLDLRGDKVRDFLKYLLANNVDRLKDRGKALYSCMLNEQGGVIDDLIVYFMDDQWFRMVVNAATRDKDLAWIEKQARGFHVDINERDELAMVAVQGPHAVDKLVSLFDEADAAAIRDLPVFTAVELGDMFVARTGYTGEDGFEIMLPNGQAAAFWQRLHEAGVAPIGLGARDTLRLEAGMNLYGSDMTEDTSPLVSGLGWTVAWEPAERDFIGRAALEAERGQGGHERLVGLVLQDKGVLRNHMKVVVEGVGEGEITSGSFSPTLGRSIAFARVPGATGDRVKVEIRGRLLDASVVKAPFVRKGKSCLPDDV